MLTNKSFENRDIKTSNTIQEVHIGSLIFSLNKEENTADVIGNDSAKGDIIIPKTIKYINQEFTVTTIKESSFQKSQVRSIQFPADSEVRTIERGSFASPLLKSLTLPASVAGLDRGWCFELPGLTKVRVHESSRRYKMRGKFIIGKSDPKSDRFDVLVFACRDMKSAVIPPSIARIDPYAFAYTKIEKIEIPPHITEICEGAFFNCKQLRKIDIPDDSQLRVVGRRSFYNTKIEKMSIPSFTELREGWRAAALKLGAIRVIECKQAGQRNISCYEDKFIVGKSDSKSDNFDVLIFAFRDIKSAAIPPFIRRISPYAFAYTKIESIEIPSHITEICEGAFFNCTQLRKIEFPEISELKAIGKGAFANSKIEYFTIPSHVKEICSDTFSFCFQLQKVDIQKNSELQKIEKNAFRCSLVESVTIPSGAALADGWCIGTSRLANVQIAEDSRRNLSYHENKFLLGKTCPGGGEFDVLEFARRDAKLAAVPPFVKRIGSYAFAYTQIDSIIIFSLCANLRVIEIEENSSMQSKNIFKFENKNAVIMIPVKMFDHLSL